MLKGLFVLKMFQTLRGIFGHIENTAGLKT